MRDSMPETAELVTDFPGRLVADSTKMSKHLLQRNLKILAIASFSTVHQGDRLPNTSTAQNDAGTNPDIHRFNGGLELFLSSLHWISRQKEFNGYCPDRSESKNGTQTIPSQLQLEPVFCASEPTWRKV